MYRPAMMFVIVVVFCLSCRNVNQTPTPLSDEDCAKADCSTLSIQYASGDSSAGVTADIGLKTSGDHATEISWYSDNPVRISDTGSVLRPKNSLGDIMVNLTATVRKGSASETKGYALLVTKNDPMFVTFLVTVPAGTPPGDSICMSNQLTGWTFMPCAKVSANTYRIQIEKEDPNTLMVYKYNRGSPSSIETGASGEEIMNRTYIFMKTEETVNDAVLSWKDL